METLILTAIGIAAFAYVGRLVWRSLSGKNACNCGTTGTCKSTPVECEFCKKK